MDKFSYLGSCISSTEKDINTRLAKAWTAFDRLSVIWKSDLTDKRKRSFFQAVVVSILLLYGRTTWTQTKRMEKKLGSNYTRMLRAILNKSWGQQPTKQQLFRHLPPIRKTVQDRLTRHIEHCWRNEDALISDIIPWTPSHGRVNAGWSARTYIRGTFNKFPDFFVQAFNIVIDSWKFNMLLLSILWDDWPIFMISHSNEQLQQ